MQTELVSNVNLTTKDYVQMLSWLVTSIGGIIAASIALYQMRQSRRQRVEELRWKKASTALELINQLHRNPYSSTAIHILDWWDADRLTITVDETPVEVSHAQLREILCKRRSEVTDKTAQYVWDSFDWMFYFIDRIAHFERITLVEVGDVLPVFSPYLLRIDTHRHLFDQLITAQGYTNLEEKLKSTRMQTRHTNVHTSKPA